MRYSLLAVSYTHLAVAVAFTIDETVDFAPVAKPFVADVASVCPFGSLIVMFGTARLFACSLKIVCLLYTSSRQFPLFEFPEMPNVFR